MSEHYFRFRLACLRHGTSPRSSLNVAMDAAIVSAAEGFLKANGEEAYEERLIEQRERHHLSEKRFSLGAGRSKVIVGASICGVSLGQANRDADGILDVALNAPRLGPLVTMKSEFFWAAMHQARADEDGEQWPEQGLSWREFRVLSAILSSKVNRHKFSFIGWESIQARSSGFASKAELREAVTIPDHLKPKLTRWQISDTVARLEDLGFFLRFRYSRGKRGGFSAYSFRHATRKDLAEAVAEWAKFTGGGYNKENRVSDAEFCSQLLETRKSPASVQQPTPQGNPQPTPQHNEKSPNEKSPNEKSLNELPPTGTSGFDSFDLSKEEQQ